MKQTCLINAKKDEKGIAGQARNDRSFRMKTTKKIRLIILLFVSYASAALSQNLDSIPEAQRDSILLVRAKEAVLKYGPGYYREYKEPVIKKVEFPPKDAIIPEGTIISHKFHYEVTYLYDKSKEQLNENYAAKVTFSVITGKALGVYFGCGTGINIPEDSDLRSSEEIRPIRYQPGRSLTVIVLEPTILDEQAAPDE